MSWLLLVWIIGAVIYWDYQKGKNAAIRKARAEYHDRLKGMRVDNPDQPYELSQECVND